jgi:dCTP deaminase
MSVLSDKEIRARCEVPETYFDQASYDALIIHQDATGWPLMAMAADDLRKSIRHACTRLITDEERKAFKPMIEPFAPRLVNQIADGITKPMGSNADGSLNMVTVPTNVRKIISYGTSSYGYDVRCAREFKIFTNINSTVIDPKAFDERNFVDFRGDVCIIPPNSFALARTVEYFRIPRDILTVCLGKSTYARCGIVVNVTPLEPEWEGHVTLEFSNTTPLPAKIYANEGVAQMLFFHANDPCETSYKDRGGKYQGQTGVVPPRV